LSKVTIDTQLIINDMFSTMHAQDGIGLAATQVGISQRIAVVNLSGSIDDNLVLVNPIILKKHGEIEIEEGCLSIPQQRHTVRRARTIIFSALDYQGTEYQMEARDLLSVCVQHEIDHLDGVLFVDHLSSLKRQRVKKKLEKSIKQRMRYP
jgi:peptide deformylase